MRARSSYESSISDKFKVHAPSLVSHVGRSAPIGFSLIRGHGTGEFTKPTQAQDAYAISIFLQPSPKLAMKVNGRVLAPQSVAAGGVIISHLETVPGVRFNGPFDFVRCYVTKETLDELAEPARTPPLDGLRRPDFGTKDLVLYHLAVSAAPLIERGDPTDQLVLDQIALAVCSRLTLAYAGAPRDPRGLGRGRGGLAPWQERRAKDFIEANLGRPVGLAEIATQCGLSPSYFSRAFRNNTGRPPHRWLTERRIEQAKLALAADNEELSQIAGRLGFSDTSHFSRVFSSLTGLTPAVWRRNRGSGHTDGTDGLMGQA
ncbi:MAG: AraC family transcriptional regulator [Azospirillaceae bacterium]|nr:AraC family transcriptional regulator [Azospirillaceae bacterium]